MAKQNATFRDIDLSFQTHPVTGDIVIKTDLSAVMQSVRNLVLTSAGEILWQPEIGGGINQLMFEPNDVMLQMMLHDKILNTITMFEPRVELVDITVAKFANGNGINISVTFYFMNSSEPITETIAIKRTR